MSYLHTHTRLFAWLAIVMLLLMLAPPTRAAGVTWTITSSSDNVNDGDAAARTGSLRFILSQVQSGDTIHVGDLEADTINIGTPLVVPAGVALGAARSENCTGYDRPLVTIADPSLYPMSAVTTLISLGAGATLRNIALLAGKTAIRVAGADVDICGVGIGRTVGGDGDPITRPPWEHSHHCRRAKCGCPSQLHQWRGEHHRSRQRHTDRQCYR